MSQQKILVIRRENIGDLICTTPLIRALREQLPDANIQALVSRYNVPVLYGNVDLDEVHSYQKAKHRQENEGRFHIYWERFNTIRYLRRQKIDWILLPGGPHASALRFSRMIGCRQLLIRRQRNASDGRHEVEQTCRMLEDMGLVYTTPKLRLTADLSDAQVILRDVETRLGFRPARIFGVHISARKVSQQWSAESFARFIASLPLAASDSVAIFWAPGPRDDPHHPGDDDKAARVLELLVGLPVVPIRTQKLSELIAGLSVCTNLVCADGGAMHIAAALDKPMVCLFGRSDEQHWGPWGVPHTILKGPQDDVRNIAPEAVLASWQALSALW